jgi:hypothetical protein
MEPQDDPEARIRELERPLADTARASELGGTQPPGGYPYPPGPPVYPPGPPVPPLPPAYNYDGPYPGTSGRSSPGARVWWILAAVIVIGVLVLVGGIAAFAGHRLTRGNVVIASPTPTISRSTTSPRSTPRSPTPSASAPRTPSAAPSTSPAAPPGSSIIVSGVNENRTIACSDNSVTVTGVSDTVAITGHCASLTVTGMQNSVTVDSVDTIDVSGLSNHVAYHSGSPKITNSGLSNVVEKG